MKEEFKEVERKREQELQGIRFDTKTEIESPNIFTQPNAFFSKHIKRFINVLYFKKNLNNSLIEPLPAHYKVISPIKACTDAEKKAKCD